MTPDGVPALERAALKGISERLRATLDRRTPIVVDLTRRIYEHPELSLEEEQAAAWCREVLADAGLSIADVEGVPTAFVATIEGAKEGPTVGLLAEYDALPGLGHACGHNLIAGTAVGAGLLLAEHAAELAGSVRVYGCPAEETLVGKVRMISAGAFDDLEYALTFHPHDRTSVMTSSNGLREYKMTFTGKASHAGHDPWDGISALDGVLLTFQNVNAFRQFLRDGSRVHGIVVEGGVSPSIVPETASCRISVRGTEPAELERVAERVLECARAAAMASGTTVEIEAVTAVEPVRLDPSLDALMRETLDLLGELEVEDWPALASTDFGDVSQRVPGILFSVKTWPRGTAFHTKETAVYAGEAEAFEALLKATHAMATCAGALLELAPDAR
jgi:amidohydrolase